MGNHKATAQQWQTVEDWATCRGSVFDICLLELRSRVEALEAQAQQQQSAPTPPGLVEQVRQAMDTASVEQEPRAAIRAVAEWLRQEGYGAVGEWLQESAAQ
jgi:hypothetical protein